MQDKVVGIVIPIYNVQNYLRECLDSVVNQTYKNLKVVLINDGSTDENSLNIAKEYTLKDERITLFDKKNGGHSSAKNVGIEYFKNKYNFKKIKENDLLEFEIDGNNPYSIYKVYKNCEILDYENKFQEFIHPCIDYIIFLDSDDYWKFDCIQKCVDRMNGVEIVWFDFELNIENNFRKKFKTEMEIFDFKEEKVISSNAWLKKCANIEYLFWFAWQGMIDFIFLKKINLEFINEIPHEDHHFGICLFSSARYIFIYPEKKYVYRIRQNSISNQKNIIINKESYLYDLFMKLEYDFDKLKEYQMAQNWIMSTFYLINFIKSNNLNHIEDIFLPILLDKCLIALFICKDPLFLYKILNSFDVYFKKYNLYGTELIKHSLEYKLGNYFIQNKNLINFIKNIKKIQKDYVLGQVIFKNNINKMKYINIAENDNIYINIIKKHLSYRIGKLLRKILCI